MNQPARTTPKPAELPQLRALVADDLARVNQLIITQGQSEIALINDLASHIIAAGGKRLRPSLTIAAAKLCSYEGDRHVRLAACVEFIHTATLLHDDVVDESDLRRGRPTANAVWDNKSSILVGDFLFSRAFQLMVADGSLDVLEILSEASALISAGEVHQLMVSHDLTVTQEIYEQVVAAKTAVLFASACELGAIVSGNEHWRAPLRRYGHAIGMAFQMVDDSLDYQANEADLGKSIGDDLREGKVTLPIIIAYAAANETEKHFWESVMADDAEITQEHLQHAKELLLKHKAIEKTLKVADAFAEAAIAALAEFPENAAKVALLEAAEFATRRGY